MPYLLIIGAKSDIAKAIANKYAENGYDLYLAARNSKELETFAQDIRVKTDKKVECLELDILDFASHQDFYNNLNEKPEGVASAVGYLGDQTESQKEFNEAQTIINTNYTGVVSLLNVIASNFEARKSGFIIGISSVAGERGRQSNYTYGSAKAALSAYLSGLRNRLTASNVAVITVKPGFVDTQMTEDMDLPKALTATPQQVADDVYNAQVNGKNIIYTRWFWKWIMLIIKTIPEWKFKQLKL
ncbi:MAG: short-chain dehydrogenase [Hyphomicrobiales bacterium]|nr:MAG: short-chain dehydrogenase [Hyphomicrobiales bacterium]